MQLTGERTLPAPRQRAWDALNDPDTLKACIAGCESLTRNADGGFDALVAVKVGPVSARFKGKLKLTDVQPPERYTIHFDGQGGVAGFGKGSADVSLAEAGPAQTLLRYDAKAQVGGKLAQIGSRLVDSAAAKVADDFFAAFEARLAAENAAAAGAPVPEPVAPEPPASRKGIWIVAGLVIVIAVYLLFFR